MRNRQTGITLIGWLVLLTPIAVLGFVGIKLTPVYLNYKNVSKALNDVAADFKGDETFSPQEIRTAVEKAFETSYVDFPGAKDIAVFREGKARVIEAKYEQETYLFLNLWLLSKFDKRVELN